MKKSQIQHYGFRLVVNKSELAQFKKAFENNLLGNSEVQKLYKFIDSWSMDNLEYEKVWQQYGLLPPHIALRVMATGSVLPDCYNETDEEGGYLPCYEHEELAEVAMEMGLVAKRVQERIEEIIRHRTVTEEYYEVTTPLALPDYTRESSDD